MAWVTEDSVQVVYGFLDASGHRATVSVFMDGAETDPTGGGPLALGTAMQAISNDFLAITECRIRAGNSSPGTPSDGPYARGADKLNLVFRAEDGSLARMQVGAPNEGVLESDKTNVDRADAAIVALVSAMTSYGRSAEGGLLTGLQLGYRKRNSGRKGL